MCNLQKIFAEAIIGAKNLKKIAVIISHGYLCIEKHEKIQA
jgi:hypothetical protein